MIGLQLSSENSWSLSLWLVIRRQGYNDKYRGLVTVDFILSAVTTAYNCNLGTRDFLVVGPAGRRQGYNCNLGTRDFLVAGPVATRQGYYCNLGTRDFLGCRPSWKMTGLQL